MSRRDGTSNGYVVNPVKFFAVHGARIAAIKRPCMFCGLPVDGNEWPPHLAAEHPGAFVGDKGADRAERLRCEPMREARGIKTLRCRECAKPFETKRQVADHERTVHK